MSKQINPAVWTTYMQMALETKANILNTGAVEINRTDPLSQGGITFVRPYQNALDTVSDPEGYIATTTLSPKTLGDQKEVLLVANEQEGYYGLSYNDLVRGSNDTVLAAKKDIAEVATRSLQTWLVAVAQGAFGTALATSHQYDASAVGDGYISPTSLIKGTQEVYGEGMQDMTTLVMNSLVFADLQIMNLVSYHDAGTFGQNILATGTIPAYNGMRIVINDTMCAEESGLYPTYIIKGQPFYLGYAQTLIVETARDILTGGGKDIVTWKHSFVPGLKYVSWTGSAPTPSTAVAKSDFSNSANWTKLTVDNKKIGIMRILTAGGRS